MLDLAVRCGLVYDGPGAPPRRADVGIAGGRIAALGDLTGAEATRSIAAAGLAVTPGFIDCHTHSDSTLFAHPAADSAVGQGVTTHVAGNCGYSCAPIADPGLARHLVVGSDASLEASWRSLGEYFAALERVGIGINLACFVGHGSVRAAAMGLDSRPAAVGEIERMFEGLEQALAEGAIGDVDGARVRAGEQRRPAPARRALRGRRAARRHPRDPRAEPRRRLSGWLRRSAGDHPADRRAPHIVTKHGAAAGATDWALERFEQARGRGLEGYWADLAVLDLARVESRATLEDFARFPLGIAHVLVNGTPVVEDGRTTGARPGHVLRRG